MGYLDENGEINVGKYYEINFPDDKSIESADDKLIEDCLKNLDKIVLCTDMRKIESCFT